MFHKCTLCCTKYYLVLQHFLDLCTKKRISMFSTELCTNKLLTQVPANQSLIKNCFVICIALIFTVSMASIHICRKISNYDVRRCCLDNTLIKSLLLFGFCNLPEEFLRSALAVGFSWLRFAPSAFVGELIR
jgi:hypothetical protein